MKTVEDDGNPANGPDIVEADVNNQNSTNSQTPNSAVRGSQSWPGPEQNASLPTRERSNGSAYVPLHGMMPPGTSLSAYPPPPEMDALSGNEMSGTSPDAGQSGRPTPNSSTASDHLAPAPPHMNRSGRSSFETSPVMPNLNMPGTSQGEIDSSANAINSFFTDPSTFDIPSGVSTGLTPQPRFSVPDTPGTFSMPSEWPEMPSQPGMTPVAQGVLRSILAMGTMDTMDLGWDSNP